VGIRPGAQPVVEIRGEVDIQSAAQLREELLRVVRRYGPQLALDLTGVTFLECAGVNVLLATRRRARLDGGWVRIIRASPRARRTISLLGLRETFALCAPASIRLIRHGKLLRRPSRPPDEHQAADR
jgi:anti-anti-sigma factor